MDTGLEQASEQELNRLIDQADLIDKLETDPAWKVLRQIADKIVDKAVTEFAVKTSPDDTVRIIELQTIIKKYKWALFDEIERMKQESKYAFDEAQERGIIGNFFESVRSKILK